jgi:hypothetical protein
MAFLKLAEIQWHFGIGIGRKMNWHQVSGELEMKLFT